MEKWEFIGYLYLKSNALVLADAHEIFGGYEELGEFAKKRTMEELESHKLENPFLNEACLVLKHTSDPILIQKKQEQDQEQGGLPEHIPTRVAVYGKRSESTTAGGSTAYDEIRVLFHTARVLDFT